MSLNDTGSVVSSFIHFHIISISGACLEDKQFPKTNSLHEGRAQPLADMEEFALKIKVSQILSAHLCSSASLFIHWIISSLRFLSLLTSNI